MEIKTSFKNELIHEMNINCSNKQFVQFLYRAFVQRSRTVCAILVEGIMRNISMEFFWIWASG